jgi:hypothetical protein
MALAYSYRVLWLSRSGFTSGVPAVPMMMMPDDLVTVKP